MRCVLALATTLDFYLPSEQRARTTVEEKACLCRAFALLLALSFVLLSRYLMWALPLVLACSHYCRATMYHVGRADPKVAVGELTTCLAGVATSAETAAWNHDPPSGVFLDFFWLLAVSDHRKSLCGVLCGGFDGDFYGSLHGSLQGVCMEFVRSSDLVFMEFLRSLYVVCLEFLWFVRVVNEIGPRFVQSTWTISLEPPRRAFFETMGDFQSPILHELGSLCAAR